MRKFDPIIQQSIYYIGAITFLVLCFYDTSSALLSYLLATIIGGPIVSGFYHRFVSHRSWECPRWLEVSLLFLSAGYSLTPAIAWASVHKKHHRFVDTEKDPHGPVHSFWHNLKIGLWPVQIKYAGRSVLRDDAYKAQYDYYWHINILFLILSTVTVGWYVWFATVGYLYLTLVMVNMLGHDSDGNWRNSHLLSIPLAGELYHKHHHENPGDPRFGLMDWPYYIMIRWFNGNNLDR